MSKNSENTQFQNATASTLKAISGNMIEEREIKFSGSTSYLSSKEVRLPIISKELDGSELYKLRGEADNGDKKLTIAELHSYVQKNVEDTTKALYSDLPQIPILFTSRPDRVICRLP